MKKTVTVYITEKGRADAGKYARLKQFFGITGMTVNGEATVNITDEATWNILQQTAARGFIEIRNK